MSNYRPIQAKGILRPMKGEWFGASYNMNLYRGCEHRCIYCDSRSACYGVENFDHEVLYKENAIELLHMELGTKQRKGVIGTGSMSDPYTFAEDKLKLTRRALEVIAGRMWPVHIMTKSDMVKRDVDILHKINNKTLAAVTFTITTPDDILSSKIEPFAPSTSRRLDAMSYLLINNVETGAIITPVLPFIR